MLRLKTINKKSKVILILMFTTILACLLYLPWKAEKHSAYGNVTIHQLGYTFIGSKPNIYTESDLVVAKSHDTFTEISEEYKNKNNAEVYPDWVKQTQRIDYLQVTINIGISIIFWTIILLLINL